MHIQEEYIGIAAGVFTGVSMLPQLIKILREKKAEDISITMLLVLVTGLALWVYYGILKNDQPIFVTNLFSLLVNISMIIASMIYKKKHKLL